MIPGFFSVSSSEMGSFLITTDDSSTTATEGEEEEERGEVDRNDRERLLPAIKERTREKQTNFNQRGKSCSFFSFLFFVTVNLM